MILLYALAATLRTTVVLSNTARKVGKSRETPQTREPHLPMRLCLLHALQQHTTDVALKGLGNHHLGCLCMAVDQEFTLLFSRRTQRDMANGRLECKRLYLSCLCNQCRSTTNEGGSQIARIG